MRDGRGQEETIATVQVDFSQPERFGLVYDAPDGSRQPVIMIHRGTVGSMERVTAALLERYQGRLPLWLAPVQVCVLPVSPGQDEAAAGWPTACSPRGCDPAWMCGCSARGSGTAGSAATTSSRSWGRPRPRRGPCG